jgi:hypothetical protein
LSEQGSVSSLEEGFDYLMELQRGSLLEQGLA